MRAFALIALAALAVPLTAQVPLTVDTSFRFYYPNDMIAHWDTIAGQSWTPLVGDLTMRLDGRIMAIGTKLMPLDDVPWGTGHAVILSETGNPLLFPTPISGGKIIEIPSTNQYLNGNGRRFNYDGSIDWSFAGDSPFSIGMQHGNGGWVVFDDRSCLMSGWFVLNGDTICLVKRDEWGQVDTTNFPLRKVTGGPNIGGQYIYRLANGQYLFNGRNWTHYDGHPADCVVRLNADGSVDTSFHFNSLRSLIPSIHEQADGKIIMSGIIWMNDDPDTLDVVRINVDGSLDSTFNNYTDFRLGPNPNSDLLGEVLVVKPLDEGRFLVGGYFNEANGQPRGSIACIDTAGNLLDCWAGGGLHPTGGPPYPSAVLYGFECFGDQGCFLYGHYAGITDANGWHPEQVLMSMLHMPTLGVAENAPQVETVKVWPNPGSGELRLQWAGMHTAQAEVRDVLGRTVRGPLQLQAPFTLDLATLPAGLYHLLLTAPSGRQAAAKWMKE